MSDTDYKDFVFPDGDTPPPPPSASSHNVEDEKYTLVPSTSHNVEKEQLINQIFGGLMNKCFDLLTSDQLNAIKWMIDNGIMKLVSPEPPTGATGGKTHKRKSYKKKGRK